MNTTETHAKYPLGPAALRAEIVRLLELATTSDLRFLYFYLKNRESKQ